jgi:hypothetical protein
MHFFGAPLEASPLAVYTSGFLFLWALGVASSALTCVLQQRA